MAEEIARFKEFSTSNFANRLVYIDPLLKNWFSPSINPFQINTTDSEQVNLMTQELKVIFKVLLQSKSGSQQGWAFSNQMEALLSPCIATLLRRNKSSFADLQRFMDDNNNHDLVMLGQSSPNLQHRQLFREKFSSKLFSATKHAIYTRMQVILNDPIFQKLINQNTTINLQQLIEQKKIVLFRLPLGAAWTDSIQAYGRFIVGWLRIIALQRSHLAKRRRVPIYLIADEFQNFISEDIEVALTQLRKYGLHLILANQYVGQSASPSLQKALFSAGVKIAGKNDKKSLASLANEMDLKIDELSQLKVGQFYVQQWNQRAIKIQTPDYLIGHNHTMSFQMWHKLLNKNLSLYYAKQKETDTDLLCEEILQSNNATGWKKSNLTHLKPKYHNVWDSQKNK